MKRRKRRKPVDRRVTVCFAFAAAAVILIVFLIAGAVRSLPRKSGQSPEAVPDPQKMTVTGASTGFPATVNESSEASWSGGSGASALAEAEAPSGSIAAAAAELSESGASAAGASEEGAAKDDPPLTELEKGLAYLDGLDERKPEEAERMIEESRIRYDREKERRAYSKKRKAYLKKIEETVWERFGDSVFLGDSRIEGFDVYGFLPPERILADPGDTISSITDRMEEIRALSPKYIFISYGINDIGCGLWPTSKEYAKAFSSQLDALRTAFPDAEIYVNSILPAREDAVQSHPIWGGLPEYSEAVRKKSLRKGVSFINNDSLMEEHADLYAMDGVHVQPDFYRYWALNQLLGIYDKKHGYLTFPQEDPEPARKQSSSPDAEGVSRSKNADG